MAVSPFFIVTRTLPSGTKRFIARFLNPDGSIMRSTTLQDPKIHTKSQAVREADRLLKEGIVPKAEDPFLYDFLMNFWRQDSDYVKSKARRKRPLSEQYIAQSRELVEKQLKELCIKKRLSSMNPGFLEQVIEFLEKRGICERSINIRIQTITVAVRWRARQNKLPDPFFGFEKLPETPHERGVINGKELGKLLKLDDYEPRAKAAVYLGVLCGLRMGKVLGLQWPDIDFDEGVLKICHNIPSKTKKVVEPKWHSERTIPLPDILADVLKTIQGMPMISTVFVIYNIRNKQKSATEVYLRKVLKRMLVEIGISIELQVK
jgi:integrase